MKCPHCGFISRRDYDYCPYCGEKVGVEKDGLRRVIHIGRFFEVKVKTLLYLLLGNAFVVVFVLDLLLQFKYSIGLYFVGAVILTVIAIEALRVKKSVLTFLEKVDFGILTFLILCAFLLRFDGVFDARPYIICYVIPAYIIVSTVALFMALLLLGSKTIKPLWSDALLIYHAAIATTILVFMFVGEGIYNFSLANPPAQPDPLNPLPPEELKYMWENFFFVPFCIIIGKKNHPLGTGFLIEQIVVITSVALSWLYVFDFNFILFGHIFREVRSSYGDRD